MQETKEDNITSTEPKVERLSGREAQDFMNQVLMDVAGADTLEEANTILVGRPRLGETKGASETIHCKVTPAWKKTILDDAASQGMSLSDYLRDCLTRRHRELQPTV